MNLTFVYLSAFVADCKRLKVTDEDLQSLESVLLANPSIGPIVAGTGGVRKLRFAPISRGIGKSGGTRIIYAHFPKAAHLYFIIGYGKSEQGNLTAAEKNMCRDLMSQIKKYLGVYS